MNINKTQLLSALKKTLPGVEKGGSIIEGADTFVFSNNAVHSYNDSISVSTSLPLDKGMTGAVKSVDFLKLISKIPEDSIELTRTETTFQIKAGKTDAEMAVVSSTIADYIATLNIDALKWKPVPAGFFDAVRLCKISCNHSPLRGLFISEGFIRSTDIYRINRHSVPADMGTFWIDDPAVNELLKIDGLKNYSVGETWIHFQAEDGTVFSCKRRDESSYPVQKIDETIDNYGRDKSCLDNELPAGLPGVVDRISSLAADVDGMPAVRMTIRKDGIEFFSERASGRIREDLALTKPFSEDVNLVLWVDPDFLMEASRKVRTFYIKTVPGKNGKERQSLVFYNSDYIQIVSSFVGMK